MIMATLADIVKIKTLALAVKESEEFYREAKKTN